MRPTSPVPAVLILAALAILSRDAAAQAPGDTATNAVDAYRTGDYERAAELYQRAYEAAPGANLLYGWAQSLRLSGSCGRALELYDRLLTDPALTEVQRDAVRASRDQPCTEKPVQPPPDPEPEPEPKATEPKAPIEVSVSAPPRSEPSPWYRDRLGHALLAAGVVSGAAGGYLFHRSAETRDHAADQPTRPKLEAMFSRAERDRAIAIGAVAVGGALVIGAVIRYATGDRGGHHRIEVGAAATPGGATAIVAGRF